ncbi:nuclease A inhibitor family protein [Taibaiella soli]|uniref:Nuclease n=1 Tax=Taibaiella soli TaxID=1649169 RepID=A0A2W2ACH3_9BACT|nr:nuclease A inhibitor family protein [Taibaiella soli]PZF71322.1 hypothetical protein DN068_18680 [Taibaiella soli]
MLNETMIATATSLIDGLLYLSESESEFDVFDLSGIVSEDALKATLLHQKDLEENVEIESGDVNGFFIKLIQLADPNDDFMMEQASKFEVLQKFLKDNFQDIQLYRASKIQVHIFITATNNDGDYLVLHTLSVET